MARYFTALRLAALSIAACTVDSFVNNLRPSFSVALPKLYRVSEPTVSVCLRMSSSFPEDTDLDPSSLSESESVDPLPKGVSNFTSSTDQFAKELDRRKIEFALDDDIEESPLNTETTLRNEVKSEIRFRSGDELIELRQRVAELREELEDAKEYCESIGKYAAKDQLAAKKRVRQLETTISKLCLQDAEFCYVFMTEVAARAQKEGDVQNAKKATLEAAEARKCIPQLNMHGLWVGKYGEHGYEMVNITYTGDKLIAWKVTGDQNVPKGEITFTCDLAPRLQFQPSPLEPIELNAKSSRQWGKKYLPRYSGQGQVASGGYRNAQWMDGQLILVGKFFSFAWVPIGHQVFFGRPTPELVIKMIKEQEKEDMNKDPAAQMRKMAEAMMDETYWSEIERDFFNEEGCFE